MSWPNCPTRLSRLTRNRIAWHRQPRQHRDTTSSFVSEDNFSLDVVRTELMIGIDFAKSADGLARDRCG